MRRRYLDRTRRLDGRCAIPHSLAHGTGRTHRHAGGRPISENRAGSLTQCSKFWSICSRTMPMLTPARRRISSRANSLRPASRTSRPRSVVRAGSAGRRATSADQPVAWFVSRLCEGGMRAARRRLPRLHRVSRRIWVLNPLMREIIIERAMALSEGRCCCPEARGHRADRVVECSSSRSIR